MKIRLEHVRALSPVLGVKYRLTRADFDIDIERFLAESP